MCQPAFEFKYFELFTQDELIEVYPQYRRMIQKYALKTLSINIRHFIHLVKYNYMNEVSF